MIGYRTGANDARDPARSPAWNEQYRFAFPITEEREETRQLEALMVAQLTTGLAAQAGEKGEADIEAFYENLEGFGEPTRVEFSLYERDPRSLVDDVRGWREL